jgi:ferredoxin-NADP reductase
MPTHTVKLLRREEVAEGTMSFYFDKPPDFQFKPGQYLDCSLIDPPEADDEGNIRSFSIASAPAEKHLMVATRMRDTAFKRVLKRSRSEASSRLTGLWVLSPCMVMRRGRQFSSQGVLASHLFVA